MANAKKCDRCGILYTTERIDGAMVVDGWAVRSIGLYSHNGNRLGNYDLCPKCSHELEIWLKEVSYDRNVSRPSVTGDEENKNSYGEDCEES